ncbi:MAG: lipoyl synthase [Deferrisomatales bacterium]|nr:lipoyl synthase [Deferrisomatales bacterium]
MLPDPHRKPPWLKVKVADGPRYRAVRHAVTRQGLHTVCQEARCPNQGECWGAGTATFLLLGEVCTRGCHFCAVTRGDPGGAVDASEPRRVADAVHSMGLEYAVLTSVSRDDLPDGGAGVFAATLRELQGLATPPRTEVLIPDYARRDLDTVLAAGPDVLAHNLEVVERLTPLLRHRRFGYRSSLAVLQRASASAWGGVVKSSLLLGLGEREEEVSRSLDDLLAAGTRILVLGQYLQPTREHAPVVEYVPPERFERWAEEGRRRGFRYVAAGPLVRTSYRAAEAFTSGRCG